MIKIKKLKPKDAEYLLRDEKKVLVGNGVIIGKGADNLMRRIKPRGENAMDAFLKDVDDFLGDDSNKDDFY